MLQVLLNVDWCTDFALDCISILQQYFNVILMMICLRSAANLLQAAHARVCNELDIEMQLLEQLSQELTHAEYV